MQTHIPNPSCIRPPEAAPGSSEETELKARTPIDSVIALGLLSKLDRCSMAPFKHYSLYPIRSRSLTPDGGAKPEALQSFLYI